MTFQRYNIVVCAIVCIGIASLVPTTWAAYCHGKPSPDAHVNTNPIYTKDAVLVRLM